MRAAVESVLATVAALARSKGTNIITAASEPEALTLSINWAALRQVLLGLLLCALDCAGGRVELATASTKRELRIRVLASPPTPGVSGGPPSPVSAEDSRLTSVRQLVEMHGGELLVAGEASGGVELVASLPATSQVTVLVIEDNPDMRDLLKRYLAAGGYRAVEASTSAAAIEAIQREQPCAVALDVMMPVQDGWEILQVLKTHPSTRQIPVVVCSVLRERELALSLGASELLPKPITQRQLLEALARRRAAEPT